MLFKKVLKTQTNLDMPLLKVYVVCNKKILGTITCVIKEELRVITISDIICKQNNKGYGSVMMKELLNYARQNGFMYIDGWLSEVDYDHKERLYHFYQKFGFEIIQNQDGNKFADIKLKL